MIGRPYEAEIRTTLAHGYADADCFLCCTNAKVRRKLSTASELSRFVSPNSVRSDIRLGRTPRVLCDRHRDKRLLYYCKPDCYFCFWLSLLRDRGPLLTEEIFLCM